ncbi:hypothetical protein ACHWQZ_G016680 [Mnemiopsis leidyi]
MTEVMHHVILFLSALSCVFCNTEDLRISSSPSLEAGPINWKQQITISCTWTPGSMKFADIFVGEESIFTHPVYGPIVSQEDPEARLFFSQDIALGTAELVIKDITEADNNAFSCMVSRIGRGNPVTLEVLEPPTAGVSGLTATPDFTSVLLTWEAVDGATNYNVAWRASGTEDWNAADVPGTEHTFEGLNVASDYEAKVEASNDAGIREGIEPAEVSFTTKDNRPPHPVGGLTVHEAAYNATTITLSWNIQDNTAENRIVTGITATAAKEGAVEGDPAIEPQELAAEATTATFQLPGPGDYIFKITTKNDFSEGVDTSAMELHTVKETTTPPPPPTTPEPTTKKPTTAAPTTEAKEPTEGDIDLGTGGENIDCGDIQSIQPFANQQASLKCTVPDDANFAPSDITWTFQAGDATPVEQEQIINSEIGVVTFDNTTSILTIKSVTADTVGTYTCHEATHNSSCPFVVLTTKDGPTTGAASFALSSVLALAIFLIALF